MNIQPHRGTLILMLGILGLVVFQPLGIVAWIMGSGDLKAMAAGTMDPSGMKNTKVGKVCGIIGTILFSIMLVLIALFLTLFKLHVLPYPVFGSIGFFSYDNVVASPET